MALTRVVSVRLGESGCNVQQHDGNNRHCAPALKPPPPSPLLPRLSNTHPPPSPPPSVSPLQHSPPPLLLLFAPPLTPSFSVSPLPLLRLCLLPHSRLPCFFQLPRPFTSTSHLLLTYHPSFPHPSLTPSSLKPILTSTPTIIHLSISIRSNIHPTYILNCHPSLSISPSFTSNLFSSPALSPTTPFPTPTPTHSHPNSLCSTHPPRHPHSPPTHQPVQDTQRLSIFRVVGLVS